jgi:NitT/TauT family transport system substrate-binding protein
MTVSTPRLISGIFGAAAGAAALFGIASASAGDLKLRLEWTPIAIHSWYFLALDKGWYKEEGVNLTIEPGAGSVNTTQVVAAGSHDVGQAGQATMAAGRQQGLPVKAIGALIRKNEMGILVPKDSPYNSVKDLVDNNIKIVTSPGSFEIPFLEPWFKMAGTDFKKANMMYVDAKLKTSTYLTGEAGAVSTSPATMRSLFEAQRPSKFMLMSEVGMNVPGTGIIANENAIKNKAQDIRGFLKATYRAFDHIVGKKNYEEAYETLIRMRPEAKVPKEVMLGQFRDHETFWVTDATKGKPWGYMAPSDWDEAIKNLKLAGSVAVDAKAADFYTNDLLPAVTN